MEFRHEEKASVFLPHAVLTRRTPSIRQTPARVAPPRAAGCQTLASVFLPPAYVSPPHAILFLPNAFVQDGPV